ncbi:MULTISPECIES: M48 family metallopeptidase [unclassified Phaeobacter]|uniref:M48 family metallopeptidase n=1 Tax=unclassified Phaeobacter TaxID=2621772 RepID=UPI003A85E087
MSKNFTLVYGEERIPYAVNPDPKRTTRIAIHVDPDGSVVVDAPPEFEDSRVQSAVQKRARWVIDNVVEARHRFDHVRPKEYVSGEQVLYLGRRYVLKVIQETVDKPSVRLKGNRLVVTTRSGDPEDVRGRMRGWYRVKARDYFARRLTELASRLPWIDAEPSFRLLNMTRQWGSCSPNGQINLNPNLIKAPRECVEYVLMHELAHLKHHDHGPEFWKLIDHHVPEWNDTKRNLDIMAEVFLAN